MGKLVSEAVQNLRSRFDGLITLIESAHQNIESDVLIKLSTLDQDVDALCKDVENSEPKVARDVQPLMAELITKLDGFAQGLIAYQQRMQ